MKRTKLVGLCISLAATLAPMLSHAQMGPGGMGGGPGAGAPKGPQADVLPEVDERIAADPQKIFARAEKAYNAHDWLEAIAYFQHLRTKFSYNSLSTVAELRLADIAFQRERWAEAKSYYRSFLRLHPKHEKSDYAAFQLGMCAYSDIPSDLFFEPPSFERDQTEVRVALDLMREFARNYPGSQHVPEAKKIAAQCEDRLAQHEIYVAKFYAKRSKWAGVASRAEGLARTYPNSSLVPEALLMAIEARTRLDQKEAARKNLDDLVAMKAPEEFINRGQELLGKASKNP
jgi:outer membrane protein assembly factor BamD